MPAASSRVGGQVEQLGRAGVDSRLEHARVVHDEGHAQAGLKTEAAVIEVVVVVAQGLAVVRGDDGQGLFHQPCRLQLVEQDADLGVVVGDLLVVAGDVEGEIVALLEHLRAADAEHLLPALPGDVDLLAGIEVLVVDEAILPFLRRVVGKVRVEIVDPQEVGPGAIDAVEELKRQTVDRLGAVGVFSLFNLDLPRLDVGVESLIEAEVRTQGAVGHHRVGGVARSLQLLGEHRELARDLQAHLADDAVVARIGGGEDRGEAGAGLRPLHRGLIEAHPLGRQRVDHRRRRTDVAVGGEVVGAQGVDGDQEDVAGGRQLRPGGRWTGGLYALAARLGEQQKRHQAEQQRRTGRRPAFRSRVPIGKVRTCHGGSLLKVGRIVAAPGSEPAKHTALGVGEWSVTQVPATRVPATRVPATRGPRGCRGT